MVSILVDADALITAISNSVPSSTVASSVTTASTNLSAAYSATTTSSIDASHTSSTPTKTISSTSFTATTNNIPTTAPAVQNIASQITEVSQSTTFEKQVAQNAVDGLLDSYSQTNEGDLDPYIKLLLASVYNIKWVNLAYGDQSVAYRKLNIYDGFGFSASYYISNALCTATPGSRKSKIQTQLCSRVGENDNVILLFLKLTFQV